MFRKIHGCGIGCLRAAAIGVPPIFWQQVNEQAQVHCLLAFDTPVHHISSKDETMPWRNVHAHVPNLLAKRANVKVGPYARIHGHENVDGHVDVWPAGSKGALFAVVGVRDLGHGGRVVRHYETLGLVFGAWSPCTRTSGRVRITQR